MKWFAPAAVAAALLAGAPPLSADAPRGFCTAPNSRTILSNDQVRVYSVPTRPRRRGPRQTHACLYATNRSTALDDGGGASSSAFPPPGMALRGHLLAYAYYLGPEGDFSAEKRLVAIDLRRHFRRFIQVRLRGEAIGSMGISARRGVAWITCPGPGADVPSSDPGPSCTRPGSSRVAVWAVAPGPRPRVISLARGRRVDPDSLRVRRMRASWVEGGRRISERMPTQ